MGTELLNLSILYKPSKKLRGVWVAHVLDLDVVTQGDSPTHAFQMALEAAGLVVLADREAGKDRSRRKAPSRFWTAFRKVTEEGHPIERIGQDTDIAAVAMVVQVWVLDRPAKTLKATVPPISKPEHAPAIAWAL